jgi:hypothetical protein
MRPSPFLSERREESAVMPADFAPVYAELRAIMLRAADGMTVAKDEPDDLELLAAWAHPLRPKGPI